MSRIHKISFLLLSVTLIVGCIIFYQRSTADYALTVHGAVRKASKNEFGLPRADIKFLSNFTGALIDRVPENSVELRNAIKSAVITGYEEKKSLLSEKMEANTEREKLIAYMLLRVNGSIPIYNQTGLPPNDLSLLLTSDKGNCTDYAIRLLMLLDVFGIQGRTVTIWTPSTYGHVVVDAYDPVEKKVYLLDPNFNVFSKFESAGSGFVDILLSMDTSKRKKYFEDRGNIIFFPFYVTATINMALSIDTFRENMYLTAEDDWLATLIYEAPMLIAEWRKRYPSPHISMNLNDYMMSSGLTALNRFDIQSPLSAESLWQKAGK